jgi:serine/threonine-protein kinase RsbW
MHPFSQKTSLQHGMRECALYLCLIPPTVEVKGLKTEPSSRGSMLVQFKYLDKRAATDVYAPPQHEEMLRAIYANLDAETAPRILTSPQNTTEGGESEYKIDLIRSMNFVRIRVDRYGSNIVPDIRNKLRELCLQHWDVIHLILNLSDPQTSLLCRRFEEFGFFFAGILPLGLPSGDALILQYLNTNCPPSSTIHTASDFGDELVAYVRSRNPNPTEPDTESG